MLAQVVLAQLHGVLAVVDREQLETATISDERIAAAFISKLQQLQQAERPAAGAAHIRTILHESFAIYQAQWRVAAFVLEVICITCIISKNIEEHDLVQN